MSKSMFILILLIMSTTICLAGDWEKSADLGLNFSQSSYNDAWIGDEQGTIIWTMLSDIVTEKNYSEKTSWKNTIKLAYGQTQTESKNTIGRRSWSSPEKSTDRIFVESLLKLNRSGTLNPFVAMILESQFQDEGKNFLKPALWTESAGFGRSLKKNTTTDLFSRVGFAYRQRVIQGAAAISDGGLEWVSDLSHTFNAQLKMVTKIRMFKALASSAEADLEAAGKKDYWKQTDLAWEITFYASVSKYIQTTLFFEVLYDKEIDTSKRYRQNLGVGLVYKMF